VIAIVGENTNFVAEETTADFGPGVTVDSVSVTDATHATVTLDVTGSAGPGFRNVVMTTGTESAVLLDGFLVSPSIPLVLTATGTGHPDAAVLAGGVCAVCSHAGGGGDFGYHGHVCHH